MTVATKTRNFEKTSKVRTMRRVLKTRTKRKRRITWSWVRWVRAGGGGTLVRSTEGVGHADPKSQGWVALRISPVSVSGPATKHDGPGITFTTSFGYGPVAATEKVQHNTSD